MHQGSRTTTAPPDGVGRRHGPRGARTKETGGSGWASPVSPAPLPSSAASPAPSSARGEWATHRRHTRSLRPGTGYSWRARAGLTASTRGGRPACTRRQAGRRGPCDGPVISRCPLRRPRVLADDRRPAYALTGSRALTCGPSNGLASARITPRRTPPLSQSDHMTSAGPASAGAKAGI